MTRPCDWPLHRDSANALSATTASTSIPAATSKIRNAIATTVTLRMGAELMGAHRTL